MFGLTTAASANLLFCLVTAVSRRWGVMKGRFGNYTHQIASVEICPQGFFNPRCKIAAWLPSSCTAEESSEGDAVKRHGKSEIAQHGETNQEMIQPGPMDKHHFPYTCPHLPNATEQAEPLRKTGLDHDQKVEANPKLAIAPVQRCQIVSVASFVIWARTRSSE